MAIITAAFDHQITDVGIGNTSDLLEEVLPAQTVQVPCL